MHHYACGGVLGIGLHRTADQTRRLHAVVAAHRQIVALRLRIVAAFHLPDTSPVQLGRITILFVAGDHTAFAANALRHVEVESVLFALLKG
jgi:hypothetical protein